MIDVEWIVLPFPPGLSLCSCWGSCRLELPDSLTGDGPHGEKCTDEIWCRDTEQIKKEKLIPLENERQIKHVQVAQGLFLLGMCVYFMCGGYFYSCPQRAEGGRVTLLSSFCSSAQFFKNAAPVLAEQIDSVVPALVILNQDARKVLPCTSVRV